MWRVEGRVTNDDGEPLTKVCVAVGPRGCDPYSPHTDDRGVYWFDVARVPTIVYDMYFITDGYAVVWHRIQPRGTSEFNVVLRRKPG